MSWNRDNTHFIIFCHFRLIYLPSSNLSIEILLHAFVHDAVVLDQRGQRFLPWVRARSKRAVIGRLLGQFSGQLGLEMSLGQMSVEVALVFVDASTKVAHDGVRCFHLGSWGFDEVVPRWDISVRSRVRLWRSASCKNKKFTSKLESDIKFWQVFCRLHGETHWQSWFIVERI